MPDITLPCMLQGKRSKLENLRFWGISKNGQMPSHDKIIFHMLFGTFHITLRI